MSTKPNTSKSTILLPESLRTQLKGFRRDLWRIKIMEVVWAGFFGLIASYLTVFLLDRFIPTSGAVRLCILIAGVSAFSVFGPLWINRWVFKHRRENQIAQLIAKQYPRLGDRLLGVVELQSQNENNTALSPRLREAAMAQVAEEFLKRDLQTALPITWHKKWGLAVGALVVLVAAAWITTPKAGFNSLQRWLMPLAPIERYTQTQIDTSSLPNNYFVAQGEPFSIVLKLSENSNTPNHAKAKIGLTEWQTATEEQRSYTFRFAKAFNEQNLTIKVGDLVHKLKVIPIVRPTLESLSATVEFPAYLQRNNQRIELTSGIASVVEGSQLTIKGIANRSLSSAKASLQSLSSDTTGSSASSATLAANVTDDTFTLPPIHIAKSHQDLQLSWTDKHQISCLTATHLSIENTQDMAPNVYLENIAEELFVLENATVSFGIFAEDDFGLKLAGFEWSGAFTKPSPHSEAKGSLPAIHGSPQLSSSRETIDFSLQAYEIRPQKLTIRAWAEDYKEGRQRSYSEPITVYVLTKAEHRERIEQQTQSTINKLEELMRTERDALDENKRLQRLSGQQLQQLENREKLNQQAEKERNNADAMQELSQKMKEVFEEASKNDQIDSATLKKLADSALEMRNMAQQKMPEISKQLDESTSRENTEQKAKELVEDAVKKQEQLLEEMEKSINKMAEANKQLEAGTFVNRLTKAAEDEEGLARALVRMMLNVSSGAGAQNFITSEFENLDPELQRKVVALYTQQKQTGTELRWIEEDLGHFYLRTQQKEYNDLLEKIKASNIHTEMDELLNQLERSENNITALRAQRTAALLREWAKELSAATKKQQSANGGGGGGATGSETDDFEFMLRVLRLIQQETAVRDRIRSLEQKQLLLKNTQPQPSTQPL